MKKRFYTNEEVAEGLVKSMYKVLKSKLDKASKKGIVEDVLDDNRVAEVDPNRVPKSGESVIQKFEKSEEFISESINNYKDIVSKFNKIK